MQRRDRGLQHVHSSVASAEQRDRPVKLSASRGDLLRIPAGTILLGEQHELAVGVTGVTPGVVEQHQCEETVHVGLVGH